MATVLGVDGCKRGWFYVALDDEGVAHGVVPTVAQLVEEFDYAVQLFIDIPIGLCDEAPGRRGCDVAARKLLGPRASSVFTTPSRPACYAASYQEANELNRTHVGMGLSRQAWAIAPKIREVDALVRDGDGYSIEIREVHPELCFWALAGQVPMEFPKGDSFGLIERVEVLEEYLPGAEDFVQEAARTSVGVSADDCFDALAAAVTARAGVLESIPGEPEYDSEGLRMEIVYAG